MILERPELPELMKGGQQEPMDVPPTSPQVEELENDQTNMLRVLHENMSVQAMESTTNPPTPAGELLSSPPTPGAMQVLPCSHTAPLTSKSPIPVSAGGGGGHDQV